MSEGTVELAVEEHTGVTVRDITTALAAKATQFAKDTPGDPGDRLIAATLAHRTDSTRDC